MSERVVMGKRLRAEKLEGEDKLWRQGTDMSLSWEHLPPHAVYCVNKNSCMKLKRLTGQEVASVCHLILLSVLMVRPMSGFRFSLFSDTSSDRGLLLP